MNITLVKAVAALIPVCLLIIWSGVLFARDKTPGRFLQALGAGCLLIVVLTHVAEALDLFAFMHWGEEQSLGHYLDLSSAVLGVTLWPLGYAVHALTKRTSS